MRKGVTAIQNVQLLKWCAELGVLPVWNHLFGFPGELRSDYAEISRIVPLVSHLRPPIGWGRIRVDRFSPYHDRPSDFGISTLRAARPYELLFQWTPNELAELAYYFDADFPLDEGIAEEWKRLGDLLLAWKSRRLPRTSLTWRSERTRVVIEESAEPESTQTVLDGLAAFAYMSCSEITSARKIFDDAAGKKLAANEKEVTNVLNSFVERGLAICERSGYLSLATQIS